MSYQSEAQLEKQLIEDLSKRNYEKITIPDMDSLIENFRIQINKFNKEKLNGKDLSDKEFSRLIAEIDRKSVYQSSKILRDKLTLERDDGTVIYLEFFNGKDVSKNIFQVTNQVTVKDKYKNRYDVTILMNGLPIIQIELKRRGIDIKQAFNQIERYRKHSYSGLFRYVQIFVISNGVDTKYFANTDTKPLYSLAFFWTEIDNTRITTLKDFSQAFLNKNHVVKMLDKYMIINDADKMIMVMRPYQVYAVEALIKTALETANGGFIWHTTGSGKTLTSFKASQLLAKEKTVKKVIFVVDRNDLDTQTTKEFNKFEEDSVDTTANTKVLLEQLADVDRKLIVTTIQKLSNTVKEKYKDLLQTLEDEKIIIIFDECHRSTFGDMLKEIKKKFKKAQLFGFTGTPRFEQNKSQDGRTTADIFGKCLHTYLIKEAIKDQNVLGFSVEYIQTFSGQYDETDDTKVHGIDTSEVFDSPERIALVAYHIVAYHNLKTRNRQYTAIFATSSVPNLIKYYDEFKNVKDNNLKIAAVFSYGQNEDSEGRDEHSRDSLERIIKDYNKMFGTKYTTDTFSAYNKDISKKVKTAQIDILIVVDMYLTGFDSKPLNTLYVDKNLEYHNLLQAYSRTNRVEQMTKPFGNIVCYRNLKKKTDDAIKLFSQTDNIDNVLMKDYQHYLTLFKEKLIELFKIAKTPKDVDNLETEDEQREFIVAFRELSKVLMVLNTFTEFEFDEDISEMTYQEYEVLRVKYYELYSKIKNENEYVKASILNDIDFSIELISTDRINVSYIMNLIRNVEREDKEKQKKEIEHIKSEMERSDSFELHKKVDLIKEFLDKVLPKVDVEESIDDAYDSFENKQRSKEIKEFAKENSLEPKFLENEISEYEFTGIINRESILSNIKASFLKKTKISKKVISFMESIVLKYQ